MRLPLLVAAVLLAVSVNAAAESARVLPVLSQESGRVEALLLLDPPASDSSKRALDRVLNLSPSTRGAGASLQIAAGNQGFTTLSLDAQPGLALLCRGNIGLAAALGALGEQCMLADMGAVSDPLLSAGSDRRVGLESGWRSADSRLDVRFGLSWLDALYAPDALSNSALLTPTSPSPATHGFDGLSPLLPLNITSRELSASGRYQLGEQSWLQITAARSRTFTSGLSLATPLRFDTSALMLDASYGAFSGRLTGRLIEVPRGNPIGSRGQSAEASSFDVDLGVSWRTPWKARLTVGARNLLGNPDVSQWPLTSLPQSAEGDSDTRTPYVRYHQDL